MDLSLEECVVLFNPYPEQYERYVQESCFIINTTGWECKNSSVSLPSLNHMINTHYSNMIPYAKAMYGMPYIEKDLCNCEAK